MYENEYTTRRIPIGTFVLKDNAYGVEAQLRAIMKKGYDKYDVEHGEDDVQGVFPYIAYHIDGKYIFRGQIRFGAWDVIDGPLFDLNHACSEANTHELTSPRKQR